MHVGFVGGRGKVIGLGLNVSWGKPTWNSGSHCVNANHKQLKACRDEESAPQLPSPLS